MLASSQDKDFIQAYTGCELVALDLKRIFLACASNPSEDMEILLKEAKILEQQVLERASSNLRELFPNLQKKWQATAGPGQLHSELLGAAHLCRALVALRKGTEVEQLVGELFVLPELSQTWNGIQDQAGSANPARGADTKLASFLDAILAWLSSTNTALMWLVRSLTAFGESTNANTSRPYLVPSLHLLTNSVLKASLEHIEKHFPNVFSMSSHAEVFVNNYRKCKKFLTDFSNAMPLLERQYFSQNAVGANFMDKFKIQVYFVMRQNEHLRALEVVSSTSTAGDGYADAAAPSAGIPNTNFQATAVLCEQLTVLWDDRYYLDMLFGKGLRLCVEMIGRYSEFMKQLLAVRSKESEVAMHIAADISVVEKFLSANNKFVTTILTKLDPRQSSTTILSTHHESMLAASKANIVTVFNESIVILAKVREQVESTVIAATTTEATTQFNGLRGVAGLYRMQGKPAPTRASPYVEAALRGYHFNNKIFCTTTYYLLTF